MRDLRDAHSLGVLIPVEKHRARAASRRGLPVQHSRRNPFGLLGDCCSQLEIIEMSHGKTLLAKERARLL
jgi:hypothetical protein